MSGSAGVAFNIMKTIPQDVLDAAKVIASVNGICTADDVLYDEEHFRLGLAVAMTKLEKQRRARTHSRWLRLNAAAEVMRRHFGGGEE